MNTRTGPPTDIELLAKASDRNKDRIEELEKCINTQNDELTELFKDAENMCIWLFWALFTGFISFIVLLIDFINN